MILIRSLPGSKYTVDDILEFEEINLEDMILRVIESKQNNVMKWEYDKDSSCIKLSLTDVFYMLTNDSRFSSSEESSISDGNRSDSGSIRSCHPEMTTWSDECWD